MTGSQPLSPDERAQAFRQATSGFVQRFDKQIACGMGEEELAIALRETLGIFGGSGGPGTLHVTYQGAGLKIWASHDIHNHVTAKPMWQGSSTVKMAREIYQIADPTDAQISLL